MLQLAGDVLAPPLGEVGYDHPGVEGARLGPHAQLLDGVLLEVQEAQVVILRDTLGSASGGQRAPEWLRAGGAHPPGSRPRGARPWWRRSHSRLKRPLRVPASGWFHKGL